MQTEIKWDNIPQHIGKELIIINNKGVKKKVYVNKIGELIIPGSSVTPTVFVCSSQKPNDLKIFINE